MRISAALLCLLCVLPFVYPAQTRVLDSIQNLIDNAPTEEEAAVQKASLVYRYFLAGLTKESEKLRQEMWDQAERLGTDRALGAAYNTQGIMYYYQSKFDSAIPIFEKSIEYRRKAGDFPGVLKTLSNLGGIYYMQREREKSLRCYEEALKLEEQLGYAEGQYVSINNLGALYHEMGIHSKAMLYYRRGMAKYEKDNSSGNLAMSYDGMFKAHSDLGNMDSAIYFARKCLEAARSVGDVNGQGFALHNIGVIYHRQKKYDQAVAMMRQIIPLTYQVEDRRLRLGAYGQMAASFVEQNQSDSALKYAEFLLPLQEELHNSALDEDLAKVFAELHYRRRNYKLAYDYIKKYDRVRDSVYNVDMNAELAEMQEKYESEKKERENRVLQSENEGHKTRQAYLLLILGFALLSIVGGIFAYTKIRKAHHTITGQKALVEQKQKEIMDSINYAKRIQYALLASQQLLKKYLPEHFVFFKPKDVVSGDFYWASPTEDGFAIVAGDCTGHGVPGAFMSLLNITKLGQVINEHKITRPDLVLNKVRDEIIRSLNPEDRSEDSRDGMDAIICKFRLDKMQLQYAAANNSFYIVRNKKVIACKADKMPVGRGHDDTLPFTFNEVQLEKGDTIYLFTDGFADQFGGPLGKKFKYKQLEHLLVSLSDEPLQKQREQLETEFERWRGALEQVDDVCVIGVRV